MKKKSQKIRIISKNEERLIHPSELLLPLNSFVNLINFLENLESQFKDYEGSMQKRNQIVDFQKFIDSRLLRTRHYIHAFQENDCVMIEAMSKKSPYWVDLLINASPYVIETLNFLIDSNQDNLTHRLALFIRRRNFLPQEANDQLIAKNIIRAFQFISRFVNITIERPN